MWCYYSSWVCQNIYSSQFCKQIFECTELNFCAQLRFVNRNVGSYIKAVSLSCMHMCFVYEIDEVEKRQHSFHFLWGSPKTGNNYINWTSLSVNFHHWKLIRRRSRGIVLGSLSGDRKPPGFESRQLISIHRVISLSKIYVPTDSGQLSLSIDYQLRPGYGGNVAFVGWQVTRILVCSAKFLYCNFSVRKPQIPIQLQGPYVRLLIVEELAGMIESPLSGLTTVSTHEV